MWKVIASVPAIAIDSPMSRMICGSSGGRKPA